MTNPSTLRAPGTRAGGLGHPNVAVRIRDAVGTYQHGCIVHQRYGFRTLLGPQGGPHTCEGRGHAKWKSESVISCWTARDRQRGVTRCHFFRLTRGSLVSMCCRFCVVELLDSLFLLPCTFQLSQGCSVSMFKRILRDRCHLLRAELTSG